MRRSRRVNCWTERILFSGKFKEGGEDEEERVQENWKSKQREVVFDEGNFEEREGES